MARWFLQDYYDACMIHVYSDQWCMPSRHKILTGYARLNEVEGMRFKVFTTLKYCDTSLLYNCDNIVRLSIVCSLLTNSC